jgi:hypothetical protein
LISNELTEKVDADQEIDYDSDADSILVDDYVVTYLRKAEAKICD